MRINYITNLRAFAAFSVVFIHVASGLLDSDMSLPLGGGGNVFFRILSPCG